MYYKAIGATKYMSKIIYIYIIQYAKNKIDDYII